MLTLRPRLLKELKSAAHDRRYRGKRRGVVGGRVQQRGLCHRRRLLWKRRRNRGKQRHLHIAACFSTGGRLWSWRKRRNRREKREWRNQGMFLDPAVWRHPLSWDTRRGRGGNPGDRRCHMEGHRQGHEHGHRGMERGEPRQFLRLPLRPGRRRRLDTGPGGGLALISPATYNRIGPGARFPRGGGPRAFLATSPSFHLC